MSEIGKPVREFEVVEEPMFNPQPMEVEPEIEHEEIEMPIEVEEPVEV